VEKITTLISENREKHNALLPKFTDCAAKITTTMLKPLGAQLLRKLIIHRVEEVVNFAPARAG